MSKNKPFYAVLCLVLCVFLVIVAIGSFIVAIWSEDERWGYMGALFILPSIILGGIAGFGLSDL